MGGQVVEGELLQSLTASPLLKLFRCITTSISMEARDFPSFSFATCRILFAISFADCTFMEGKLRSQVWSFTRV